MCVNTMCCLCVLQGGQGLPGARGDTVSHPHQSSVILTHSVALWTSEYETQCFSECLFVEELFCHYRVNQVCRGHKGQRVTEVRR